MSLRLTTQWLCYLLALSAGPFWSPVRGVTVKNPPSNPATVQAQAKFFQDFFSVQLSPHKIEFGHVCEDPHNWEQRYEKKDFKNHRDMGKVRWGDKKGGYGEHYWDLNHAGNAGNHGDDGYEGNSDDGSYHVNESPNEHYDDGPSDHGSYSNDDYNPETSSYEENGRAKRAHPRVKAERKPQKEYNNEDTNQRHTLRKHKGKKAEQLEAAPSHKVEEYEEEEEEEEEEPEVYKKPKKRQQQRIKEDYQPKEEKNQVVLVVKEKDDAPEQSQYQPQHVTPQPQLPQYVNYEGGAGVRQHQLQEASASAPRLFLEHSTGRVVDRATGQAYILQPILNHY